MKYYILLISVLFISVFSGCKDDDPVQPSFSITEKINNARPLNSIYIQNADTGNWRFERSEGSGNLFNDAYAENGYFIVIAGNSSHYFNLALAKQILIYEKTIMIYY